MDKVRIGIIGCGNISGNYLGNARTFPILDVAVLADLDVARAKAKAAEFNVPRACSVDELLADKSIQIVINLTIPKAHGPVALAAIAAGKHVWNEKPLALTRVEGRKLLDAAKAKGVRVGGAPDTFFGAGHQTARKLIDDGAIGRPVAAQAVMLTPGHERWHPDPEFYYKPGGGPMFDMGPYYLADLLQLLGRIRRVSGMASVAIPERTITHKNQDGSPGPKFGQKIKVETPDHVTGLIEFDNGCVGTIFTSFATVGVAFPSPIIIYGTTGTLLVPDPNDFDGKVKLVKLGSREQVEMPHTHTLGYGRSVGVADLAYAIHSGRKHRGSAELVFSVLDAMEGFLDSSKSGSVYELTSPFERPAALPTGLKLGELDA